MTAHTIDRETLKVIVEDCVASVDNAVFYESDFARVLPARKLQRLAKAVRQAIKEALA